MTDQPKPCRSTQHCAVHGFCHRCTPSLDDAVRHLVKAISAAGITTGSGDVYTRLAATIRDAARQTTGQDDTTTHVHRLGNSDEDGGLMDDWDNCLDPNCPGPSAQEREAALAKRGLAAPTVGQPAEAHGTNSSVRTVIEHALTAYYQDSSAPSAVARAILTQHYSETLREAADAIDTETNTLKADRVLEPDRFRSCRDASAQLRRLARKDEQ